MKFVDREEIWVVNMAYAEDGRVHAFKASPSEQGTTGFSGLAARAAFSASLLISALFFFLSVIMGRQRTEPER